MVDQMDGAVVFILSTTRSGSTWLALMLGSNSRAAYVGELKAMFAGNPATCSLCDERGVACPLFHDVAAVRAKEVHPLLLERTGRDVLVDNSKVLSWSRKHTWAGGPRRTYIHLLRDPRAVVHSWRLLGRKKSHADWIEGTMRTREFLEKHQLDYRVVTYDELAERTDETLTELCDWLGLSYETQQKEYWRFDHHGPGKNGATAAFLESFRASDRPFYAKNRRSHFRDLRWKDGLDTAEQQEISGDPRVRALLADFGLELSESSLRRTRDETAANV